MNTVTQTCPLAHGRLARVTLVAILALAAACGTSSRGDRAAAGGDTSIRINGRAVDGGGLSDPLADGGEMPDRHADAGASTGGAIDANGCVGLSENYVAAASACGTRLPGDAASTLAEVCRRGVAQASLCGADAAAGMACFVAPDPSDWTCGLGEPLPNCGGDLGAALGMYCLLALGNPECASGIACELDIDCPSGAGCNDVTGQCFDEEAYCVGLPCDRDIDCPHGQTCNDAERSCVGS